MLGVLVVAVLAVILAEAEIADGGDCDRAYFKWLGLTTLLFLVLAVLK